MKSLFKIAVLTFCIFLFSAIGVSAETYGDLTYEIIDNKIAITGCDKNATEITIPNKIDGKPVVEIKREAFYNCSALTSIEIPDTITTIGAYAFDECYALENVYITDLEAWCNIDYTYSDSNPMYYAENLYLNNKPITNLVIPQGLTQIKPFTFSGCENILKATIPEDVTIIGAGAFYKCDALINIIIPEGVKTIGERAFDSCSGLLKITIPDSVTTIESYAFYGCTGLTSISFGKGVKTVGNAAFSSCSSLKDVYITDISAWCNIDFATRGSNPMSYAQNLYLKNQLVCDLIIPDSVTEIKPYLFFDCDSLKNVTIGNNVKKISFEAFAECENLSSVSIGNGVTEISDNAFYSCPSLTDVAIGNNVEKIGESAFYYCYKLKEIEIPDSVTSIGIDAFNRCRTLETVSIGKGVELIPQSAFYDCPKLKYLCLPSTLLYIRNNAFSYCNIEKVFYEGTEAQWDEVLLYSGNDSISNAEIICNSKKRTFKFETNCEQNLPEIYDYAVFQEPNLQEDNKIFLGWCENESLSGGIVTFPYYGKASTLYALWTDKSGTSLEDAFMAKADMSYTVTIPEDTDSLYFEFVPKSSREYHFYTTGNTDTYGYLYDKYKYALEINDDGGEDNNFFISYNLTAGETYYIKITAESGKQFTFYAERTTDYEINSIKVKSVDGTELKAIPKGDFLATVSFTNVCANKDATIVLAQYTKSGVFKGMMYITTENVPVGSTINITLPVNNENGNIYSLKAFTWDSYASMTPVGNFVSFPTE